MMSELLRFAAAPVFAVMAVLTGMADGGPVEILCGAASGDMWLGGMMPMYALMSAVHLPPWLALLHRT